MVVRKTVRLTKPHELGALVSPIRVEILELLQALGPSAIADLATKLERTPQSLYYHVHALSRAEVVVERERRKVGRREEVIYALAAERFEVAHRPSSPAARRALERSASALLRRAERALTKSMRDPDDGTRAICGARRVRLDADGVRRVHAAIERLDRLLAREHRRGVGRSHLWTFVLTPLALQNARSVGSSS